MIFLMSSERSGSNMLRAIMARHSAVSAPTAAHLIRILMPMLHAYGDLDDEGNFRRLAGHVLEIIGTQLGSWDAELNVDDIVERVPERSFASLFEAVYAAEADAQGKTLSFIKDNGNILWPLHLRLMFPSAKFVYLLRDPRDVALSWMNSPTHVGGIQAATKMWQAEQSSALAVCAIAGDELPILVVRYESFVADPTGQLGRLCEFVGIPPEAGMTEDFSNRAHRDEARRIANWENVAGEIKKTNFGKFRQSMSPARVRRIERRLAQEMQIVGYELTRPTTARTPLAGVAGKAMRALLSSVQLLFGGRHRQEELAVRVRRLQALRRIQSDVRRNPAALFRSGDD